MEVAWRWRIWHSAGRLMERACRARGEWCYLKAGMKSEPPIPRVSADASLPPREDHEETEMRKPFLKRQRTWRVLLGLVAMVLVIWLVPIPPDSEAVVGLDPLKVRIGLGIFLGIALLWMTEALPLAATALLVPLLAGLSGVSDVKTALGGFADPLIFLFLGGFALAAAMAYQGVDRWIAQSLVKVGRGRFLPVAFLLFGATAFLSMWMSNTATTVMMIPLALGILGRMKGGGAENSNNAIFLLLGLAYSASIGGIGMLVGSPPNGIAATKLGISFAEWAAFGVPTVLVLLPAMIGVLYLMCRPGKGLKIELVTEDFCFNGQRKITLVIFGVTALAWGFGAQIGPLLGIGGSFDTVVALSAIFLLLFFQVVRWCDIDRGTDWGVLLLFGGGIALSGILKDTGASLFLARLLGGAVAGWPIVLVIVVVVGFVIFLTELSSNTAVAALFVPIFFSVAGELGMPPSKLVLPLAIAASCAFMMPVATPPNAIVYASGLVPQCSMMRIGFALNWVFIALLGLLSILLF